MFIGQVMRGEIGTPFDRQPRIDHLQGKIGIERVADIEDGIGKEKIINVVLIIEIGKGMDDLVRIKGPDMPSFDKRISTVYTFVGATSFGVDVNHARFIPVKADQVIAETEIGFVDILVPAVDHDRFPLPVNKTCDGQVGDAFIKAYQQTVEALFTLSLNPVVG
jgi:hypothetical protein